MKRLAIYAGLILLFLCETADSEPMRASYYKQGSHTASGERFNPMGLTAAHRSLPFGTRLRVCLYGCVVVRINDRGPAVWTGKSLDLSLGAAQAIGMVRAGIATVQVFRQ